ncbi:MAG TPA: class I SAM-dependent methyltransferase [Myxococcales bacterium]|nr:class I SAM-dependent methyltransferase [Myxococcales bacterium]
MLPGPAPREFPVPQGVRSSVTLYELALLQRFAHEAGTVLEIGTHFGFTCIGMALAGAHVTSVDPHYEGPADAPDTWEPFLRNVERHELPMAGTRHAELVALYADGRGVVEPYRDISENIDHYRMGAEIRSWGMVFIDGDHVWPRPWHDVVIAKRHLAASGYIALHDVTPDWPGVFRAAKQLEQQGWPEVGRAGTLRVYQRPIR